MKKILISALGSGMGKTVVTGGLIRCLMKMGYTVAPYKCGPDYIDPSFHSLIAGIPCRNLDIFLQGKTGTLETFQKCHADIKIIEGVMGFLDGVAGGREASSYEVACLLDATVILTVNPEKTDDLISEIQRLLDEGQGARISGIIFTGCSEDTYRMLFPKVLSETGLKVYGYLPKIKEAEFASRHLGLVGAQEIGDIRERFDTIAGCLAENTDIEGLLAAAGDDFETVCDSSIKTAGKEIRKNCRIAVARDKAFSFYYEDNFDALADAGAEIVFFSPIKDELPEADGLYIGGGYPELYMRELSANKKLMRQIREGIHSGMPVVAECGGFLYMQRLMRGADGNEFLMTGIFDGEGISSDNLNRRFGYIKVCSDKDSLLFRSGEEIPAHEFHYWDCTDNGDAMEAVKKDGRSWRFGFVSDSLYAGFPHFHYGGEHDLAGRFVKKAEEYKAKKEAERRWMSLAKPLGSLGVLEKEIIRIAELKGEADIRLKKRSLIVFIADHGVTEEGVSQSDHTVTFAVAKALGRGSSTVNYPAKIAGCDVIPVDVGMTDDTPEGVINRKIARGSGNITKGAAMTEDECRRAIDAGRDMVRRQKDEGADIILLGEMGIGNTTPCAAICSVMLGADPTKTAGRGAGLSDDGLSRKIEAVRQAISINSPDINDPLDVLVKLGGFEIAALCGACLAGYEYRIPVILDGMITDTAALVACRMKPGTKRALIASHRSAEPAADMILNELGFDTMISAGVRLGEGIGAVMALPLLDQALTVYDSGHTFDELGIEPYIPYR